LLLDAAQEGIFGISNVGSITFINKSALELLDREEDEVIGMSATKLICPIEDSPESVTRSNKAILSAYLIERPAELLDREEDEVIGMSATKLICPIEDSPESVTRSNKAILSAYLIGRPAELLDSAFTKKDGTLMPIRFSSEPIEKAEKIIGAVVSFSDTKKQRERWRTCLSNRKRWRRLGD
jgi:PAS domain-containing protein